MLVQYASAKAGVILVNVNPAYRSSELEYVLNQSGCRAAGRGPAGQRFSRQLDVRTLLVYDDNREDLGGKMARLVAAAL